MIVVTPLAGRLVDRVGARQPLLIGLFGLAAATLLFAVGAPYWLLLIARATQGLAAGMSWVAGMSLIAAVTPLATRGRSMGLAMSMVSMGLLIGPPLAGVLVENFGTTAPFLFAPRSRSPPPSPGCCWCVAVGRSPTTRPDRCRTCGCPGRGR